MNYIISCDNLQLGYKNKLLGDPLDLKIEKDKWLGIMGENGTGKSTFFKTILGIIKPVSGNISIFGEPTRKNNDKISYIPQERNIHIPEKTTANSLILANYRANYWGLPVYGKKLKSKVTEILDIIGARQYQDMPFEKLSGGQKKRIFLAQALINEPMMMLLDEPLADLDPRAKHRFIKSLQAIHDHTKLSLLIVSHEMHEIHHYLDGFINFSHNEKKVIESFSECSQDKELIS